MGIEPPSKEAKDSSLEHDLNNKLSLGNQVDTRVFYSDYGSDWTTEVKSRELNQLVLASQKPETVRTLYEILADDAETFLKGLHKIGDSRGLVLINTIGSRGTNTDLTGNLINTIKLIIARRPNEAEFYLSVYLSVISNFDIVNPQHLGLFLTYLNPIREDFRDVSSLVLLIVVKNLKSQNQNTLDMITENLELLSDENTLTASQFLNFIKIIEMLFPLIPEVLDPIYCDAKTKNHILKQVANFMTDNTLKLQHSNHILITIEILKLVSSSCISEGSRTFNSKEYFELLQAGAKVKSVLEIKLLSTLDLVKIWSFVQLDKVREKASVKTSIEDLAFNLLNYLKQYPNDKNEIYLDYTIEGLAYLTLNSSVKKLLRDDEDIVDAIIKILKKKSEEKNDTQTEVNNQSLVYGLVTILFNLCKVKDPSQSKNKKTVNYLKNFATPGSVNESEKENDTTVQLFNKSLVMNYKIIEVLTRMKTFKEDDASPSSTKSSSSLINHVVNILYSILLNQERAVRNELVKQGALSFIVSYLVKHSAIQKEATGGSGETRPISADTTIIETRLLGLRSLAKMLVSVNPSVAFTKYDVRTSVPFLVELLGPDISKYTGTLDAQATSKPQDHYLHDMTNIDKYESLLALTNLSSDEKNVELRKLIIGKTFDRYLTNFIIDSDSPQIQKAAWELIANLISEPSLLVKFFNIEPDATGKISEENLNRLTLLIKLLNSDDEPLQVVLSGLLANATSEFAMIPQILIKNDKIRTELLDIIGEILINQTRSDELILRVTYLSTNLVYSAADLNSESLATFSKHEKLKVGVAKVLREGTNREVKEALVDLIKLLR